MRWLMAMPTIGAVALILAIEVRANAEPVDGDATAANVRQDTYERRSTKRSATALVRSASGSDVVGMVRFWETGEGQVGYDVELYGLAPGPHGFHVHEVGDCSAPDATSAGGHFAPEGNPHGAPDDAVRHVGDLGNVVANAEGHATFRGMDPRITLRGEHAIVQRAVVVHADADDLTSQPSGDAGDRIGCGVIRRIPTGSVTPQPPREEG